MAITHLVHGMKLLGVPFSDPTNASLAHELLRVDFLSARTIAPGHARALRHVWTDAGARRAYARRNEFHLSDSAAHFLDSVDRIATEGFVPTQEDVLRVRQPTSGIYEYCFDLQVTSHNLTSSPLLYMILLDGVT